ncbi:alpha/beta fold hydrolase [Blattabacterium cuenoti]|uniref:alpha/beta fold hydrolase n=1 Tax=Blattabacterium cuenoti TaxID=1653831 RepID=UPI00163D263C|nr:alpha/beta fold hydrolase [Blattabacterium cuenoti]
MTIDYNFFYVKKNFRLKKKEIPTIVLLHGFMGSSEIWNLIYEILSKEYRIISIDLPGHGKSIFPIKWRKKTIFTMEDGANIVGEILKKENIEKVIVIGHSMGGYISLALAEKNPYIFLGLCLLHSTAKQDTIEKKNKRIQGIHLSKLNFPLFVYNSVNSWFNKNNISSLQKEIFFAKKIAFSTDYECISCFLKGMMLRKNREFLLKTTKFPKLYIVGEYDSILDIKEIINKETKIGIKTNFTKISTGHMSHLEKPKILIDILISFIKSII